MRTAMVAALLATGMIAPATAHDRETAAAAYVGAGVVTGILNLGPNGPTAILYVHEGGSATVAGTGNRTETGPWFELHDEHSATWRGMPTTASIDPTGSSTIELTAGGRTLRISVAPSGSEARYQAWAAGSYAQGPNHFHTYRWETQTYGYRATAQGTFGDRTVTESDAVSMPSLFVGFASVTRTCTDCPGD